MRSLRLKSFIVAAVLTAFTLQGCATGQINPTDTAIAKTKADAASIAKAVTKVVDAARAVQDFEISVHCNPGTGGTSPTPCVTTLINGKAFITDADHAKIQQGFKVLFTALDAGLAKLGVVTDQPSLANTVSAISTALSEFALTLQVSNPQAAAILQTSAAAITIAFAVVQSLIH